MKEERDERRKDGIRNVRRMGERGGGTGVKERDRKKR